MLTSALSRVILQNFCAISDSWLFGIFQYLLINRGYYPKGGGEVQVKVKPTKQLRPVELTTFGTLLRITGRAFVAGVLPFKVQLFSNPTLLYLAPIKQVICHL